MNNVEVEIRSFISENQYKDLIEKFKKEADYKGEDEQVTYYFDADQDLRIQKNNNFAKIWLKKGKIHDEHREEIEIKFPVENFGHAEQLFLALGYNVQIKWFRKRHAFKWKDIDVTLDFTRGYGYIIELEQMSNEENKEKVVEYLKEKMREIGIMPTLKEEFSKKYEYYKENWAQLINQ